MNDEVADMTRQEIVALIAYHAEAIDDDTLREDAVLHVRRIKQLTELYLGE